MATKKATTKKAAKAKPARRVMVTLELETAMTVAALRLAYPRGREMFFFRGAGGHGAIVRQVSVNVIRKKG